MGEGVAGDAPYDIYFLDGAFDRLVQPRRPTAPGRGGQVDSEREH